MPKSINDLPTITQIGIFVLIAVLIGGGVFYYFVFPMFAQKTALTTELTTLRAQNEQSRVVEQQLAEYQNRIRQRPPAAAAFVAGDVGVSGQRPRHHRRPGRGDYRPAGRQHIGLRAGDTTGG